ncbi:MAG: hypothetical protein RBR87_06700 [Bacteroidales bacterium]|nr:hypothetical protein [Bacteroidales bacterium]
MNCEHYELMIFDLPFSTKEADVDTALRDHMSQCSSCRLLLNRHLAEMQQINEKRRIHPNPFFYQALHSRIENNAPTAKESAFSAKRILGLSPALMSAVAAIAFGVWIGGRLTMDFQTSPVNTSESREMMLSAVAEDLHLIDISESALETYLMDNQNPEQP